ncbi:serine/threonine-protein kinase [Streptomyces sp. SID11233]|nr:serine/threonine-protein kinase [Streptomyces sp. SID11233]
MRQVLGRRYELVEQLGSGGMGVVWRAHDRMLHRTVAVKVIAGPGISAEAVSRLEREARAAAGLSRNPHVVTVHDFGHEGPGGAAAFAAGPGGPDDTAAIADGGGERAYVVMELVDGRTLDRVLAQDGLPGPARAAEWAQQVCVALEAAHAIGIVHRDIKPSNVILGPDGVVQVLDFGLAWFRPELGLSRLSRSDVVMGGAPWISPEQAQGHAVDHRSDLYALGCLLFELLTGAPPFGGRDALAQLIAHVMEEPPAPSRAEGGRAAGAPLPAELDRLVLDLLAKSPEDRPASASVVAARLGEVREGLGEVPIRATRPVPPRPPAQPESIPPESLPPAGAQEGRGRPGRRQLLVIAVGVVATSATAVVVPYLLPDSDSGGGEGSRDGKGSGGGATDGSDRSAPPRRLWDIPLTPSAQLPDTAAGPVVVVDLRQGDASTGFEVRDTRSGDVAWTYRATKDSRGKPQDFSARLDPGGGTAYVAWQGRVDAKDATTGRARWTYEMQRPEGGGVTSGAPSLAFAEGVVYVTDLGTVAAVASDDGGELWTVPLDDTTVDTVLVGRVLLVRGLLRVYAVDVDARRVVWHKPTEQSELLTGGGTVFVTTSGTGDTASATLALGIEDGAERWSDPRAPRAVLTARGMALFVDDDEDTDGEVLRARSLDTGRKLYEQAIPSPLLGNPPQFTGNDVLAMPIRKGEGSVLIGIGLDRGTVRWRKPWGNLQNLDGAPYEKVLVTDPALLSLRALDPTTGETRWTVTPDGKAAVLDVRRVGKLLFIMTGEPPETGSAKPSRLYCLELSDVI